MFIRPLHLLQLGLPAWRQDLNEHYALVLMAWLGLGLLAFLGSMLTNAPYGRHTRGGWGPELNNRLAWFLMEVPVLLCFHWAFWTGPGPKTGPYLFFAGLFSFHYGYRALIYPWRLRTGKKRMPWAVAGMAVLFNIGNGTLLGHGLGQPTAFALSGDWPSQAWTSAAWIRVALGLSLFVGGWLVNFRADNYLISLRRSKDQGALPSSPTARTQGYVIPQHPLFKRISCPNHLGEMLEWVGFAVLTAHPAAMVFAAWTVLNVLPRSLAHHRWYREHFEDYPAERKALLPYLL